MTIINCRPVSQWVWHFKEPSLLNAHKCRVLVKICSPSPLMVTSPNEWKILEWDEKTQTNLSIHNTLIAFLCHCWYLFISSWAYWYAKYKPFWQETMILRWPWKPVDLSSYLFYCWCLTVENWLLMVFMLLSISWYAKALFHIFTDYKKHKNH